MKAQEFRNAIARITAIRPFARVQSESFINGGGVHADGVLDGSSITRSRYRSQSRNSETMIIPTIERAIMSGNNHAFQQYAIKRSSYMEFSSLEGPLLLDQVQVQ
jgi:hypothetical protein